jgi:L-2-hydroxyglutarate oxidase
MTERVDVVVVGGGIVGLASALAISSAAPGTTLVLIEKEERVGAHQTGHNSGVIHSGLYYQPGSLKARLCVAGNRSMVQFCRDHGIAHAVCGKLVVASEPWEVASLGRLEERGRANGLDVERLSPAGIREREPHVHGVAGLWVPSTGIVDYASVAESLADLVRGAGGDLRLGVTVNGLRDAGGGSRVSTDSGDIDARVVLNCGGLHSDRLAKLGGAAVPARIVPFRGEYFELIPAAADLVRGLVYPVPNPAFPFLGVHLTRTIDGGVHAGPNAVLGLKREGYRKSDVAARDVIDVLGYGGFWRLAARYRREGAAELYRSFRKKAFVRSVQRLAPEIGEGDLVPAGSGVRAQAVAPDGRLVDDFLIVEGPSSVHVCNAPSPAATASLEIGREIAGRVMRRLRDAEP